MKKAKEDPKVYTVGLCTEGGLVCAYAFTDDASAQEWERIELPKLEQYYGKLQVRKSQLPGLRVGDLCHVAGEGNDVFKIMEMFMYSPDRPGVLLDSGWTEELYKCEKVTRGWNEELHKCARAKRGKRKEQDNANFCI